MMGKNQSEIKKAFEEISSGIIRIGAVLASTFGGFSVPQAPMAANLMTTTNPPTPTNLQEEETAAKSPKVNSKKVARVGEKDAMPSTGVVVDISSSKTPSNLDQAISKPKKNRKKKTILETSEGARSGSVNNPPNPSTVIIPNEAPPPDSTIITTIPSSTAAAITKSSGLPVKSPRRPKDPNFPKRPPSSFLLFACDQRERIVRENPDLSFLEVARKMGQIWDTMDKKPYEEISARLTKEYYHKVEEYQRRSTPNETSSTAPNTLPLEKEPSETKPKKKKKSKVNHQPQDLTIDNQPIEASSSYAGRNHEDDAGMTFPPLVPPPLSLQITGINSTVPATNLAFGSDGISLESAAAAAVGQAKRKKKTSAE